MTMMQPVILDRAQLWESCGEDFDFIQEVVEEFLAVTPEMLAKLGAFTASGDGIALSYEAHKMKGSCRTIGANWLADLCQQLETAGKAGELGLASVLFAAAQSADGELRRTLTALLAEIQS